MIIVEGPDGAGKSTLVAQIEQMWGVTREPRAVSKEAKSLVPIGEYIEGELEKGFGKRIYDRFALISSPMYMGLPDRTFRDQMLDRDWLMNMHTKFKRIDPVIIICLPPLKIVKRNVNKGEDNLVVQETIEEIYWLYHNWYCSHHPFNSSTALWDYTSDDPLQFSRIEGLIRWAEARCRKER